MNRVFFLFSLFLFSAVPLTASAPCSRPKKQIDTPVWITVFVHGALKAEWLFTSMYKVLTDSLEGSTYQKALGIIRNDPYFFRLHAMQEEGLKKITTPKATAVFGASAIAYFHNQITSLTQARPTINYYYTFGWSGVMSLQTRMNESREFYAHLATEIEKIQDKHHVTPRVRLIGYSHGGNVCLHLAQAKSRSLTSCFCVDELVLIGSPVQRETERLIADPMFKKIYHFYSPDDMIQPADCFTSKISHRTFKPSHTFSLPEKLHQIGVKVASYKPKQDNKKNLKKVFVNPGHIELWYLGWAPSMYRPAFPLHPLPVVDFVSFITHQIEQEPRLKNNIMVTLYPQQECMRVKNKHGHDSLTLPFVSQQHLSEFQSIALRCKPDAQYYKEFAKRKEKALWAAHAMKHGGLVQTQKSDGSSYTVTKQATCLH